MNLAKKTIAVTGGTGFVGSHLIPKLIKQGYLVKVLTRRSNPVLPPKVTVIKGDLATGEGLDQFLKDADILIHLAARRFPPEEEMFPNNVLAAQNLLNSSFKFPLKQIVMMSTVAVYGESHKRSFVEKDECLPNTFYGLTKYLAENIIRFWGIKTGKPVTILRPFNIYGPGGNNGVIFSFCKSLKDKKELKVFGNGQERRDFLYVDDVVEAILMAISKKAIGEFNIGLGKNLSILELVDVFKKTVKRDIKIAFKKEKTSQIKHLAYSINKARKILGWIPQTPLEQGVRKTIDWL